ncbi:hypothetical protein WAI453_004607 [Rhynchosporium graminicola]
METAFIKSLPVKPLLILAVISKPLINIVIRLKVDSGYQVRILAGFPLIKVIALAQWPFRITFFTALETIDT